MQKNNSGSIRTGKTDSAGKGTMQMMGIAALVIGAGIIAYVQFSKSSDYSEVETNKTLGSTTQEVTPNPPITETTENNADTEAQTLETEAQAMKPYSIVESESPGIMKKETGYQAYSESLVSSALKEGQKVYIFFHASWCPNCISLEKNIKANLSLIPKNTLIVNADYDKETTLKQKYGVTVQTTVVTLNQDGSLAKKVLGPVSLEKILE